GGEPRRIALETRSPADVAVGLLARREDPSLEARARGSAERALQPRDLARVDADARDDSTVDPAVDVLLHVSRRCTNDTCACRWAGSGAPRAPSAARPGGSASRPGDRRSPREAARPHPTRG